MKRLSYITCTAILATGILLAAHLADLQHQLDQELIGHVEEMMKLLEDVEQENRELRQESQELQEEVDRANEMKYIRAEQRTLLASRGGRPSIPVLSASGMGADHFERAFEALSKPGMAGLGQALFDAEAETGVNALILAGIISLESAWGESQLSKERNNLAGLGAYDNCPGRAIYFEDRPACVMFLANLIVDGGTLEDVGRWYASDPAWAAKVAGCMRYIAQKSEVRS